MQTNLPSPVVNNSSVNTHSFFSKKTLKHVNEGLHLGWTILEIGHYIAEKAAQASHGCEKFLTSVEPIGQALDKTKILGFLGFATVIPKLVSAVRKVIRKPGMAKVDNSFRIVYCARSCIGYVNTSIQALNFFNFSSLLAKVGLEPAFKCVSGFTPFLSVISFVLSPISLVISARNYWKTRIFLDEFIAKTQNLSTEKEINEFFDFLIESRNCILERNFKTNATALKITLIAMKAEMERKNDYSKMKELVGTLQGRVKVTLNSEIASMVADIVYIAAAALFVASLAMPGGYILTAIGVSIYIGILVSKMDASYQFENKMGMIQRNMSSPFFKTSVLPTKTVRPVGLFASVNDFMKWLFSIQVYHTEESLAALSNYSASFEKRGGFASFDYTGCAQRYS